MDLNDTLHFADVDTEDMLGHIDGLPAQLQMAYQLGSQLRLPPMHPVNRVVVAGMGGSAIGADLLAAYLADQLVVPFYVHRDYGLPKYAMGERTLLVISSHSGDTEESLSAFEMGRANECQLLAICTGGKLAREAEENHIPLWKFDHSGQPRTAVGYSFGLLLALLDRLGLVTDKHADIADAVNVMTQLQTQIKAEVPVIQNPAKRQAGQFIGRDVTVFGSGFLAPVARRWKTQINEVAKAFASFEMLPEADHNTLAGIYHPEELIERKYVMFFDASSDHPRNRTRVAKTKEIFMLEGIATDIFVAKGETRLAQMWSTLLFGDYVAYYMALAYDTDPTSIPPIAALKEFLTR